jgi:hypothetical protein
MMKGDIYTNTINSMENIHMKQRAIGLTFVLNSREAKDRRTESQFKNT